MSEERHQHDIYVSSSGGLAHFRRALLSAISSGSGRKARDFARFCRTGAALAFSRREAQSFHDPTDIRVDPPAACGIAGHGAFCGV
jgi:hypothetical protein